MTSVSKLLVVIVTVASLTFMGLAIAASLGGPNWDAEMLELQGTAEHQGIKFARSPGAEVVWTATRARDNRELKKSPVQPEVIVEAYKAVTQDQKAQLDALQARTTEYNRVVPLWTASEQLDAQALEARQAELLTLLERTKAAASELAKEVSQKTEDAQNIETLVAERRDDVIRLREQVNQIRADAFRLAELKQELTDQLQQLRASLKRGRDRQSRLATETSAP